MKTIRPIDSESCRVITFPDGQPHVDLVGINQGDAVRVFMPIRSAHELFVLMATANALSHIFADKCELVIPYLMAARSDRVMSKGGSLDLEVVAQCINACGFNRVHIFDAHSDAATLLIKNSHSHNASKLIACYDKDDAVLVCPDAGAGKKIGDYIKWNPRIKDVVFCIKSRDLATGAVSLKVLEPDKCYDRNVVVIDDICDGGATFIAISRQISGALSKTLIVSHGIFSKGTEELGMYYNQILTTDSYRNNVAFSNVKTIPLNL